MNLLAYYKDGLSYILVFQAQDGTYHRLVNMFRPYFPRPYTIPELSKEKAFALMSGDAAMEELGFTQDEDGTWLPF